MKELKGRKKLTDEQRVISEQRKRNRAKIANMVARKPEIKKQCCICGKDDAQILHNEKDPYRISFICKECRLDEANLTKARRMRVDIRSEMNKDKLSSKNFTIKDVKKIVENYLVDILSIIDYCNKIGISRHQFNNLVERYSDIFNMPTIKTSVILHANKINNVKLSELAYERNKV